MNFISILDAHFLSWNVGSLVGLDLLPLPLELVGMAMS